MAEQAHQEREANCLGKMDQCKPGIRDPESS